MVRLANVLPFAVTPAVLPAAGDLGLAPAEVAVVVPPGAPAGPGGPGGPGGNPGGPPGDGPPGPGPGGHCPHCSILGIYFPTCILHVVPEPTVVEAAVDCHFANDLAAAPDLEKERSWQRNVLYWWYATNIYEIHGGGNRAQMPECLVTRIRDRFPSPTNIYKGFLI